MCKCANFLLLSDWKLIGTGCGQLATRQASGEFIYNAEKNAYVFFYGNYSLIASKKCIRSANTSLRSSCKLKSCYKKKYEVLVNLKLLAKRYVQCVEHQVVFPTLRVIFQSLSYRMIKLSRTYLIDPLMKCQKIQLKSPQVAFSIVKLKELFILHEWHMLLRSNDLQKPYFPPSPPFPLSHVTNCTWKFWFSLFVF